MGLDFAEWLLMKNDQNQIQDVLYDGLTVTNKEGRIALSQMEVKRWSEVTLKKKHGLLFRIDNIELEEALIVWGNAQLEKSSTEDEAALVCQCIQQKGETCSCSTRLTAVPYF